MPGRRCAPIRISLGDGRTPTWLEIEHSSNAGPSALHVPPGARPFSVSRHFQGVPEGSVLAAGRTALSAQRVPWESAAVAQLASRMGKDPGADPMVVEGPCGTVTCHLTASILALGIVSCLPQPYSYEEPPQCVYAGVWIMDSDQSSNQSGHWRRCLQLLESNEITRSLE